MVVTTRTAVPVGSTAVLGNQVSASIGKLASVQSQAIGPGDVAAPAVAVTVTVTNTSSKAVALNGIFVNLEDSAGMTGTPSVGAPSAPLAGQLAAGHKAQGVYVFVVPQNRRSAVKVFVSDPISATTVTFVGNAA